MSRLLMRLLSMDGHDVLAVGRARDLALALETGAFRAALVDIELPDGDGVALAGGLRRSHPGMRLIVMSGNPEQLERARGAGFSPLLAKPFTGGELRAALAAP